MQYANTVEFAIKGEYALFSDPITRVGGEKTSYQIPTYSAIKGCLESVYWKPTLIWIIDEVKVLNEIKTEAKGIRTLIYNSEESGKNASAELSNYTYLKDVSYAVKAHFIWNENRPDLKEDRNENKHYLIAKRMIEKGGRRDVFLGTRECQAYVYPYEYDRTRSYYDNSGTRTFGLMYHSISYPDENDKKEMIINFWNAKMSNGVIVYPPQNECLLKKVINYKRIKSFAIGKNCVIDNWDVKEND